MTLRVGLTRGACCPSELLFVPMLLGISYSALAPHNMCTCQHEARRAATFGPLTSPRSHPNVISRAKRDSKGILKTCQPEIHDVLEAWCFNSLISPPLRNPLPAQLHWWNLPELGPSYEMRCVENSQDHPSACLEQGRGILSESNVPQHGTSRPFSCLDRGETGPTGHVVVGPNRVLIAR